MSLKAVKIYSFLHPCKLCKKLIKVRHHYKHFKLFHTDIDLTRYCYLCLGIYKPLRAHRRECIASIIRERERKAQSPEIVIKGDKFHNLRNWHKTNADIPAIMGPNSPLHLFDEMPTYPTSYVPAKGNPAVKLDIQCMDGNGTPVRPLLLNETYFDTFVHWLLQNHSEIYDENVKEVIRCLLEYQEGKWYHLILSKYHFELFASLTEAINIGFTSYRCLCLTKQATERTIHAHFLVYIDDFETFRKKCWNKLSSPTSERYKMCTKIKDFHHMYSVIFYLSQKRACSNKQNSKHYDTKVHLTQRHEDLTLLVFRKLLYNNKINSAKNKTAILRFDVHELKDDRSVCQYASPAEQIVIRIDRKTLQFRNAQLQQVDEPDERCITFTGQGFVKTVDAEGSYVSMLDVIRSADGLNYWMVWYDRKKALIHMLLGVQGLKNVVAIHTDDQNIAFFGRKIRCQYRLPEEKEIARHHFFAHAEAENVIVTDSEQIYPITNVIGNTVKFSRSFFSVPTENRKCLDIAESIYDLTSRNAV